MAPLHAKRRTEHGSAALEAAFSLGLVVLIVASLLMVVYLLFARAWVGVQSEQALYCAAEARPAGECRQRLKERLERFLPFGELERVRLDSARDIWNVDVKWKFNEQYSVHARKQMSLSQIRKKRDLRL